MIFGQNPFASHSVQADEFPIGLTMVYDVWVDNFIPPGPAYGYTMEYIVTRWIDEENLLLECNRSITKSMKQQILRGMAVTLNPTIFSMQPSGMVHLRAITHLSEC
jgi:hypothetical protein